MRYICIYCSESGDWFEMEDHLVWKHYDQVITSLLLRFNPDWSKMGLLKEEDDS